MSSIYKRGKYYVYQRYVKNPITGYHDKRIYESLGKIANRKDVFLIKKQLDAKYARESVQQTIAPILFLSYCKKIYLEQKQKEVDQGRRSLNTLRTDKNSLNIFYNFIYKYYGDIDVKGISHKQIFKWRETRYADGKSPTTIAVNMRTVSSFFSYLVKTERISENPFINVDIPKRQKKDDANIPAFFSAVFKFVKKEVEKRSRATEPLVTKKKKLKKDDFDWFYDNEWFLHYTWVLLNTGMRSGEVSLLKWKQGKLDVGENHSRSYSYISDDESHFVIYFKRRRREITIKPPVRESLIFFQKFQRKNNVYLFESKRTHRPYSTSTYSKLFKKLIEHLELDTELSAHSIRHGYGSYLANNGATVYQVSRILGHSTTEITELFYTHSKHDDVSDTMDILYNVQPEKS